ncbi:SDR family oxidoreductase [Pseudonocardia sp. NPDC049154]|uniref:SDR family NAD(P)-dependent oxidoreductase n=1 Tax=Pseudonocardia sp. NPDC049154 TaxID=3155501 RepID=UPI0033C6816F
MTDDRTAIVSGAASGIGLATARRLAAQGWTLALVDLDAAAVKEAVDFPLEGHLVRATDISDPDQVSGLFAQVEAELGPLKAVANVAGLTVVEDGRIEDVSLEVFDRVVGVNLRGNFLMCKGAIPALRAAGGGAIVNVGSVASVLGTGGAAYVSSKHGLAGLTRQIAYRYAAENIRCSLVCPGPTDTPMIAIARAKGTVPAAPGAIPRDVTADEVASFIAYLVGDDAAMVTGSVHVVDGGMSQH